MKEYIRKRVREMADFVLETKRTVRETAKIFCVSKSTAHKDMSQRLKRVDYAKYVEVSKIFDVHFAEKHLHGGDATKKKYEIRRLSEKN